MNYVILFLTLLGFLDLGHANPIDANVVGVENREVHSTKRHPSVIKPTSTRTRILVPTCPVYPIYPVQPTTKKTSTARPASASKPTSKSSSKVTSKSTAKPTLKSVTKSTSKKSLKPSTTTPPATYPTLAPPSNSYPHLASQPQFTPRPLLARLPSILSSLLHPHPFLNSLPIRSESSRNAFNDYLGARSTSNEIITDEGLVDRNVQPRAEHCSPSPYEPTCPGGAPSVKALGMASVSALVAAIAVAVRMT